MKHEKKLMHYYCMHVGVHTRHVCGGKRIILWSQFFPSTSTWAPDRPQTISLVGQALYLF